MRNRCSEAISWWTGVVPERGEAPSWRVSGRRRGWTLLLLLPLGSACATVAPCTRPPSELALYLATYEDLKAEQVASEIDMLVAALRETARPAATARLHMQLAILRSHRANPRPDFRRAAEDLRAYLKLAPVREHTAAVEDWLALLTALGGSVRGSRGAAEMMARAAEVKRLQEDLSRLREANGRLVKEAQKVSEDLEQARRDNELLALENEQAREANDRLQQEINKLQVLDLQMERKRRSYR